MPGYGREVSDSVSTIPGNRVASNNRLVTSYLALIVGLVWHSSILAAPPDSGLAAEIVFLKNQINQVQLESQQKLQALQQQTDEQIAELQTRIDQLTAPLIVPRAANEAPSTAAAVKPEPATGPASKFAVSGDFRLRYEYNSDFGAIDSSDRGVLRGRLQGKYALDDTWSLGARLVTGDPDNPRTADVTLGDFAEDLELSLDQAYLDFNHKGLFLTGGKFAKPFRSTELVWDGDVSPVGAGGRLVLHSSEPWSATAAGLWFDIDDPTLAASSDMAGGQLSLDLSPANNWQLSLSGAYFDYELAPLSAQGKLSPRGNFIGADGRYVSDFNLLDIMGTAEYAGLGPDWPVRLVADYVKNTGAEVPQDQGFGADLFLGHLAEAGHFLLHYGYTQVETDAVLGLFSNDNIPLATNYELHTVSVDYRFSEHGFLGLTEYLYRWLDPVLDGIRLNDDWGSRTRLNLYFQF